MDNSNTQTLLQQALGYLTKGWSVIPISPSAKMPLISWKKYQEQLPTEEEITSWWTQFPNANIGIVTGKISNLIVVDIDPRHGGNNASFKEIITPVVKTGGGGWHYYFLYEPGIQNAAGIQDGIDVRASGGFVVAPPSVHESGKQYEWEVEPV